jgi:hypothetical protein
MINMRAHLAVLALAAAIPAAAHPQVRKTLDKPVAEFVEPFTRIATLRELTDGRVIVADEHQGTLQVIDFARGKATNIGRMGSGPGEFLSMARVIAMPGDTTALHDPRNARYLMIKPDGTPGETFRLADAVFASLGGRGSIPRSTDARGTLYFEGAPYVAGRDMTPAVFDSVPAMRYDRRTMKLDTLTWIQLAKGNVRITPGPSGRGLSITVGVHAYPVRDDWTALPDGSVAVVRVRDYHVDRYSPTGARTSGPPVQVTPVAVTETEKAAWRADRQSRVRSRSVGSVAPNLPDPEWPAVMPPFVYYETFARPNGELWVMRSHKTADAGVFDVFGPAGTIVSQVALPPRTRFVGFGNGTVYLVRRDDDDLEYLQRYRLP